jgi:hypothetical protein
MTDRPTPHPPPPATFPLFKPPKRCGPGSGPFWYRCPNHEGRTADPDIGCRLQEKKIFLFPDFPSYVLVLVLGGRRWVRSIHTYSLLRPCRVPGLGPDPRSSGKIRYSLSDCTGQTPQHFLKTIYTVPVPASPIDKKNIRYACAYPSHQSHICFCNSVSSIRPSQPGDFAKLGILNHPNPIKVFSGS